MSFFLDARVFVCRRDRHPSASIHGIHHRHPTVGEITEITEISRSPRFGIRDEELSIDDFERVKNIDR
jgi:hypothetical protein